MHILCFPENELPQFFYGMVVIGSLSMVGDGGGCGGVVFFDIIIIIKDFAITATQNQIPSVVWQIKVHCQPTLYLVNLNSFHLIKKKFKEHSKVKREKEKKQKIHQTKKVLYK